MKQRVPQFLHPVQASAVGQAARRLAVLMVLVFSCMPLHAAAEEGDKPQPIQRHQTGFHAVKLTGVPYGVFHETRLRYGWEPFDSATERYRRTPDEPYKFRNYDQVTWSVTAPQGYDPRRPAGLLVFIRPGGSGKVPGVWAEAIEDLNLVFVSVSAGTKTRPHHYAHAMAVHAVRLMAERYTLNPKRIYIAGHLNGAHVANAAAVLTPQTFRAALMINGGEFVGDLQLRGDVIPGLAPDADKRVLQQGRQSQLIVFNGLTGPKRELILLPATAYKRAGFRNVTVWDEEDHGPELIDAGKLSEAIALFDEPLHASAERDYRRAARDLERGKRDRGLTTLLQVSSDAPTTEPGRSAREQADTLLAEYAEQVAAIEAQIEAKAFDEAGQAINALRKDWGEVSDDDRDRLEDALREAQRAERRGL